MSNYVKSTNFAVKDGLPSGDPLKVVKGTEIDTEFNNIATSINSKADLSSPTFIGTPFAPTAVAGTATNQIATTSFVGTAVTNERTATATLTNKTLTSPTISSPSLTGTPTAPTASVSTNNTQVATTAFATAKVADAAPTKTGGGASGTWDINVTGTAAALTTTRTLWGQSFNGSANVSGNLTSVGNITGSGAVTLASSGDTSVNIRTNGVDRITANGTGNVGVGTSSPAVKLQVESPTHLDGIRLVNTNTANTSLKTPQITAFSTNTSGTALQTGALGFWLTDSSVSNSEFRVSLRNAGVFSDKLRLSNTGQLHINDAFSVSQFSINGNPEVGTFASFQNSSQFTLGGITVRYSLAAPNNNDNFFYYALDSTNARFYVRSNGGIGNYQANNINLSDRREKTNFAPAKPYLKTLCDIPVQTFNYIDQNQEEDPGLTLGVVAQDVQAVAPELVTESDWGTPENPKKRLSIYQTDLQYAMLKSIQELKAIVDEQGKRIQALEAAK